MKKIYYIIVVGFVFFSKGPVPVAHASTDWISATLNPGGITYGVDSQSIFQNNTSSNYLYVANGSAGVRIYQISYTLTSPITTTRTLLSTFDTAGNAEDVGIIDNTLYVIDGSNGLVVLNVTDRTHPSLITTLALPGAAHRAASAGSDSIYVADGSAGVYVIDTSDVTNPTIAGHYDTGGEAADVVGDENRIFVSDSSGGLVSLSYSATALSLHQDPTLAATYTAAAPITTLDLETRGGSDYVYAGVSGVGVSIFQATGSTLASIGSLALPGTENDLWQVDSGGLNPDHLLYIAEGTAGLKIVNVNSPAAPRLVGSFALSGTSTRLYVGQPDGPTVSKGSDGLEFVGMNSIHPDQIFPVVTLKSAGAILLPVNTTYSDAGAIATDNVDGDLTASIKTTFPASYSNGMFTATGAYTIMYQVQDAAGNTAYGFRSINVIANVSNQVQPVVTPKPSGTTVQLVNSNPPSTIQPLGSSYKESYFSKLYNFGTTKLQIIIPTGRNTSGKDMFVYRTGQKTPIAILTLSLSLAKSGLVVKPVSGSVGNGLFFILTSKANPRDSRLVGVSPQGNVTVLPFSLNNPALAKLVYKYLPLYPGASGSRLVTASFNDSRTIAIWTFVQSTQKYYKLVTFKVSKIQIKGATLSLKK
ncbi:MAG: DUF5011 domain-containing protein [Candidatus Kerfeldbacteria bacterium]|nr:DUF5011 domain-containing protein [Candidatus Kerfeldbacteria bacterium]